MNFLIWSGKEKAWWKPDGMGYTKKRSEAGVFSVEQVASHRLDRPEGDTPGNADSLILCE